MTPLRAGRTIFLVAVGALAAACSRQTPTAPTQAPVATPHPSISVASITVQGEARPAGYAYSATIQLKETAGVAATISGIDLVFLNGTATVSSSHDDHPISGTTNLCPANGSVGTKALLTEDPDASHPYATTVQVKVAFTADGGFVGSATGSTEVPPIAAPTAPQTFTLTGVITDAATHAGIAGARLEVLNGLNAGKVVTADGAGAYVFQDLFAETFRLRASATGHDSGEQNVTVPLVPRADFELRQVATTCAYTVTPSVVTAPASGGTYSVTATRTTGECSWTASSSSSWLTLAGPASGGSSATIPFTFAPTTIERFATVTIAWQGGSATIQMHQAPPRNACPPAVTYDVTADLHQFQGSLPPGCIGTWVIDVPWLKFTATHGNGVLLDLAVDANPGVARSGHLTFSDAGVVYTTFTVNQAAGDCVTAISPTSQTFDETGGTGTFAVTARSGCTWQASVNSQGFINATITSGAQGVGNGAISFTVPANPDTFGHAGFVLIGILMYQLTQAACPVTVSHSTVQMLSSGGTFALTVLAGRSFCTWTDYSNAPFIARPFEQRTGSAAVIFTVAPNTTGQSRSGTLYVAGQTVVVTQDK